MDHYSTWAEVPAHLATITQLSKLGLKPAPDQKPVGRKVGGYGPYDLYDQTQAIPKRKVEMTEARREALAKARAAQYCPRCTVRFEGRGWNSRAKDSPYCKGCYGEVEESKWAGAVLTHPTAIILDTETTGLDNDAQIVEISVIRVSGEVLLNTLVKPTCPIPPEASRIHGITAEIVADAPTWREVWPGVSWLIKQAGQVIIWNVEFDRRLMEQSCQAHRLKLPPWWAGVPFACAMRAYARWYGQWSQKYRSWRFQALGGGHRALGDCRAVVERLEEMRNRH